LFRTAILLTLGWSAVKRHDSKRLTFWLLKKEGDGKGDDKVWKKEEIRSGGQRNNFCIVVKPDTDPDE
jgi:25S rRNA (adenine2142-N1)-methyltransferase